MLTFTSVTTWRRWEQAGCGESIIAGRAKAGYADSSGAGFTGSNLVVVIMTLLVGVKQTSLVAVDLGSII